MRIDLADVRQGPVRWSETVELDETDLDHSEIVSSSPVETHGSVLYADPDFVVRGSLKVRQTLSCQRCLAETTQEIEDDFDYLVRTREIADLLAERAKLDEEDSAEEVELDEDDLEVVLTDDEELDVRRLIREQILLHIPMKPLCRPDCKGLCGTCGTDLNTDTCDCVSTDVDPRWAALAGLDLPDR